MKVKIVFFTHMQQITGLKEADIELPEGSTVANLFEELSNRFEEPIGKYFYDERTGARAISNYYCNSFWYLCFR